MHLNKLLSLLPHVGKAVRVAGGCTPLEIKEAETALGVTFPDDFIEYLSELGTLTVGSVEICGIRPGTSVKNPPFPNIVVLTLEERSGGLPNKYVMIENYGNGSLVVLNACADDTEYGGVFLYRGPYLTPVPLAKNFEQWLHDVTKAYLPPAKE